MPPLGGGKSVIFGDFSRLIIRQGSTMTLQASVAYSRRP
jgi:hypothetical protein